MPRWREIIYKIPGDGYLVDDIKPSVEHPTGVFLEYGRQIFISENEYLMSSTIQRLEEYGKIDVRGFSRPTNPSKAPPPIYGYHDKDSRMSKKQFVVTSVQEIAPKIEEIPAKEENVDAIKNLMDSYLEKIGKESEKKADMESKLLEIFGDKLKNLEQNTKKSGNEKSGLDEKLLEALSEQLKNIEQKIQQPVSGEITTKPAVQQMDASAIAEIAKQVAGSINIQQSGKGMFVTTSSKEDIYIPDVKLDKSINTDGLTFKEDVSSTESDVEAQLAELMKMRKSKKKG